MKKLLAISLLILTVMPMVLATSVGTGVGLDITTEQFAPHIWMCDNRIVYEDNVQTGRETTAGTELTERINNYAFEGEQLEWVVLVMDKNKIDEITDVVGTIGATQGVGNDIEVQCVENIGYDPDLDGTVADSCNARILEEDLSATPFDANTQAYYTCTLTVETPASMYGEYFLTVEAISVDGSAIMDENEYWFLNPIIALAINGDVTFTDVRPGTVAYSTTLTVENDADSGSGVLLDMFVSGTDFYDPAAAGARCPVSNQLTLGGADNIVSNANNGVGGVRGSTCTLSLDSTDPADHLCYFATSGAYSTAQSGLADTEGYLPVVYGDAFTVDFYNDAEIVYQDPGSRMAVGSSGTTLYHPGNMLTPNAEIAITFKLGLPEPCVGDFSEGDIYFWGEAI